MTSEDPDSRFAQVRLLSLDCDGVMTDGSLYYAADGTELRRFNVRDGVGIKALIHAGIEVAFLTASTTEAIAHRARALGVRHCLTGQEDKLGALTALCDMLGIGLAQTAHVGDDVNDLELLRAVGVPMTVADAVPAVLDVAHYVSPCPGGTGAVRDIADRILANRYDASTIEASSRAVVRPGARANSQD